MLRVWSPRLVICSLLLGLASTAYASERHARLTIDEDLDAIVSAQRDLEIAMLRWRRHVNLEHRLKMRRLDSQIRRARAARDTLARHVVEYSQFTKFKYSSPLLVSLDNAKLAQLNTEMELADLRFEKRLTQQHDAEYRRLLRLEIEAAATRLRMLSAKAKAGPISVLRAPLVAGQRASAPR